MPTPMVAAGHPAVLERFSNPEPTGKDRFFSYLDNPPPPWSNVMLRGAVSLSSHSGIREETGAKGPGQMRAPQQRVVPGRPRQPMRTRPLHPGVNASDPRRTPWPRIGDVSGRRARLPRPYHTSAPPLEKETRARWLSRAGGARPSAPLGAPCDHTKKAHEPSWFVRLCHPNRLPPAPEGRGRRVAFSWTYGARPQSKREAVGWVKACDAEP